MKLDSISNSHPEIGQVVTVRQKKFVVTDVKKNTLESNLIDNVPVQARFFITDSNWTWYASEFDGEDIFLGLVSGFEVELGYFSLSELQEVRGPWGLPIERDLHIEPQTLKELMKKPKHDRQG